MKCFSLLQRLSVLLLVGASVSVFQSCCDYEDEVANIGNSSGIKVDEIVPGSGKRILMADVAKYYYTADGFLDYVITDYGDDYITRYDFSSNKITGKLFIEDEDHKRSRKQDINFAFNEKGYISKFNYNEIDEYEDKNGEYGKEVDKAKGNYKLSYDNDGYLVKITGSTSWEDTYQGETERYQDEETITQTWNNGLLMEYKYESVLSNGDYRIYILSYDYGNKIYQNKYKQYFDIDGGVLDILFGWIGLLGKGPDYLPESMTITEIEKYEGEEYESEDTYSFSYEFNEDGTIHYIDSNYYTEFYYTYGTYEDQLNMDENETKSTRSGKRVNRNFLFGKYFMR